MGLSEAELFRASGLDYAGSASDRPSNLDHPIFTRIVRHEGHWMWHGAHGAAGPEWHGISGSEYVNVIRWLWEVCEGESLLVEHVLRNTCGHRRCVFPDHYRRDRFGTVWRALRALAGSTDRPHLRPHRSVSFPLPLLSVTYARNRALIHPFHTLMMMNPFSKRRTRDRYVGRSTACFRHAVRNSRSSQWSQRSCPWHGFHSADRPKLTVGCRTGRSRTNPAASGQSISKP
jgi:hypothetical protein